MKSAVRNSGLFLEALLAAPAGHAGIEDDLKARLLRLQWQIRQALDGLPEQSSRRDQLNKLLTLSEAALARMTMNQITSLRENHGGLLWYTEIPVLHQDQYDVIQFRFERRPQATGDDPVTVTARLNLKALGLVEAVVTLLPAKIKVTFRVEKAETVELIRNSLDQLNDDFTLYGLKTGEFFVSQSALGPFQKITGSGLVDERA